MLINNVIIISFFTLGLFVASSNDYVLYGLKIKIGELMGGRWKAQGDYEYFQFKNKFLENLWMPLLGCPVCMVSFWGVTIYSLIEKYTLNSAYELPLIITCSCAVNFILYKNLIEKYL